MREPLSHRIPGYYAERLGPLRAVAAAHPGGLVDLSLGTPVDPTPDVIGRALAAAWDAPGYPLTVGLPELRETCLGWLHSVVGAAADAEIGVLPVIGSKEFVGAAALQLGLRPGDVVAQPRLAYPTYAVGAAAAGCEIVGWDPDSDLDPRARLVWVNSPSNPDGRVLDVDETRRLVEAARAQGAVVISDECYVDFGWTAKPVSVLDPRVNGGSLDGLLALYSLSKRSNLAGYRTAFVAGDPGLVDELTSVRRNLGFIVPLPQQRAMIAALSDESHVAEQRARYAARREVLIPAFTAAGYEISRSDGGLYLWLGRPGSDGDEIAGALARDGILAVPGIAYGVDGRDHVRVAITATDEAVRVVRERLSTP